MSALIYHAINFTSVDLPEPLFQTKAVIFHHLILKSKSLNTNLSLLYQYFNFSISIFPFLYSNFFHVLYHFISGVESKKSHSFSMSTNSFVKSLKNIIHFSTAHFIIIIAETTHTIDAKEISQFKYEFHKYHKIHIINNESIILGHSKRG
ncbi:hypothetical protein ACFLY2_01575 [Patescibacteria group bacterium]